MPRVPDWTKPHYVGIDENGMGPRLGPLVVTSVVLTTTTERGAKLVRSRPSGALAKRIGDSKKLVAFDDSALGEAWARAIAARGLGVGASAKTPGELIDALLVDDVPSMRAPCPRHHLDLCWGTRGETFVASDAMVAECARDLDRLEARGVQLVRARLAVLCARRLNEGVAKGLSRFDLDLHAMERLTLAARDDVGDEVYALCGKVGGFDFYAPRFGPLAGWLHTTLVEGRARSEYHVPTVGRLGFVRDGDDSHLAIGLASLVGKWVRDHLMRRVVRFHRDGLSEAEAAVLPDASGYHDPVTTQFIEATSLVRRARKVEDPCFERLAVGKDGGGPKSSRRGPTSSARPRPPAAKRGQRPLPEGASSSRAPRPS